MRPVAGSIVDDRDDAAVPEACQIWPGADVVHGDVALDLHWRRLRAGSWTARRLSETQRDTRRTAENARPTGVAGRGGSRWFVAWLFEERVVRII